MKKLFSFLTLFMLFMGAGTAWATFSYDWGTSEGKWDFLSGVNISDFTADGWTSGGNGSRAYKDFSNAVGSTNGTLGGKEVNGGTFGTWGFNHLKFNGTITIYNYNNNTARGLYVPSGASISIHVYPGYVVSVTASTKTTSTNGDIRGNDCNCTWENVVSTPESPHFGRETKTVDVIYNGTSDGYVTLTPESGNYKNLFIEKIEMTPKPTMYWVKNGSQTTFDVLDFTQLDYDEPELQMSFIPEGATISVSASGENAEGETVAVVRTQNYSNGTLSFDLMALRAGTATVTATATLNGQEILSATYTVQIDIDQYEWDTEGKKYFLTGEGAIINPYVSAIPFIKMTYGNPINVGMVRNQNDNLVATIIDNNGWRHIWLDSNSIPHQGTFYKFEPEADGNLTVWMRLESGKAVLIDETAPATAVKTFYSQGSGVTQYETIHVTGGHTYYIYGITPNDYTPVPSNFIENGTWAVAELNAFEFIPDGNLAYDYKGLVYKDGKLYDIDGTTVRFNEARQPIGGGSYTTEYALEFYPNAEEGPSATIDSNGLLTIDETRGGAIAVKAIVKNNGEVKSRDYYIVTVPYKTHDWWFTESVDPRELAETRPAQSKQDFTTWGLAYKVLRPQYREITIDGQTKTVRLRQEVKDPVLCSAKEMHGNNAGYAIQTAGLLIDAKPQRFGVNTDMDWHLIKKYDENGNVLTVNNAQGIPIDQYLYDTSIDEEAMELDRLIGIYAYDKTYQDTYGYPTHEITMATYGTLIIPDLKAGQHIRIYWARHNVNKGDMYSATGVTDLAGTDITSNFYVGNGSGYTEFIAKGGNATFTLEQEVPSNTNSVAWTNIYRITVGEVGEFLDTGLDARVGDIVYNPRPNIPLQVLNTNNEIEIIDYNGQNLAVDYPGYTDKGHWGPMAQYNAPYSTIVNDDDNSQTLAVSSRGSTSSLSMEYKIVGNLGDEVTMSGNNITFKGNGIVGIVANGKSNGYVLDTDTLTMAYGTVDVQEYPHTWDFTKIGKNTTTPAMLADAYENGFDITWFKNGQYTDPNDKDTKDYKMWEPVADENEYKLNAYQTDIHSTLFAQGSQLTANFVPIEETKGLGIYLRKGVSGSYFGYTIANTIESGSVGLDLLRYGVTDGEGYLKFPSHEERSFIIRVPQVSKTKGERVYICATNGTPTVYQEQYANGGNGSNSEITTLAANSDGNNSYFVPENDGDVFIDVTGLKVFKIGVTSTFKNLNTYNGKSYATESRHHNERYDLSGYFMGDNITAYKVTGYTPEEEGSTNKIEDSGVRLAGKLALVPVDIADANTGVILVGDGEASDGHFKSMPLFVKDVNSDLSDTAGNMMKPSKINGNGDDNLSNVTNPYILTTSYYDEDPNNPGHPTGNKKSGPLAFYKLFSGTLNNNLAYFDMPDEGSAQVVTVEKNVKYALSVGDTFTSGQTVNVTNDNETVATITYGEDGGADFKAATEKSIENGEFTAYTAGNGTNGDKTGGTFYTIVPQYDGTITIGVSLNADKAFYILEDGTALTSFNGIKLDAKLDGTFTFSVSAGKSYKIYCDGSKLGFYGFKYNYTVTTSSGSANYYMFKFIDEDGSESEADGIEQITLEQLAEALSGENAVFYNLNGQKLNGKPSQRGVYIYNGKKFYVK